MKKYLIALSIGLVATVFFAVLAGMGGGACHCNSPLRVLFPFLALAGPGVEEQVVGELLLWLQFPLYALGLAIPESAAARSKVATTLFAVHALMAVVVYQRS